MSRIRRFLALPAAERVAYLLAIWWLLRVRVLFKTLSFDRLRAYVGQRKVRSGVDAKINVQRLAAILRNAGDHVPSTCLSRSLAGAMLLAHFGYCSEVLIGISNTHDFQAHAWLEYAGSPISDAAEAANRWTQLTRLRVGS